MSKRDKSGKLRPVEIVIIGFVCLFLLAVVWPASQMSRFDAYRTECNKNLSEIGRAMLIYANDYDDELPRSGGRNSLWASSIRDWKANNRLSAYNLLPNGAGGQANISSCFYLLVKYAEVMPRSFVCPGDAGTTEFKLADVGASDRELFDLWDFGPTPSAHCSYSYHMPFGPYSLTIANKPGIAVAADRNPWMNSSTYAAKDIRLFNPDGGRKSLKVGNAVTHDQEGQNVLFLDGHVSFEENSFCGVKNDNIYTYWDGGDIRIGAVPGLGCGPQDRIDSLLVNDPDVYKTKTTKQPRHIKSTDLKQTSVVATLDCPLPEHKNVIWCSTFQMAWDKLKQDIIGEPVEILGAEELASRMNQAQFISENLEAESFYATAGFVENGIIEQIQKEMTKRFSSEPATVFDERYRTLPMALAAYAYLSVDIGFEHPFHDAEKAFTFEDSSGKRTDVTSFNEGGDSKVREQVEILHYKYDRSRDAAEFAVDLCIHTRPYQVVLARVPWSSALHEAVKNVQENISEFKQDPDYDVLRKLRPIDRLIVPDVLYKLTHHFAELEGKYLGNPKWRERGYFIFEAKQMVDFALSRTGVILKSQAIIGAAGAAPPPRRIEEPRYFYFNKPFLIYVKKRGPDYSPFFAMWVDNTELMEKF